MNSKIIITPEGELIYSASPRTHGGQGQFNIPKCIWSKEKLAKKYLIIAKPITGKSCLKIE